MTQGMIDAKMRPGGRLETIVDIAADDSDKSWTVGNQKFWKLLWINARLACTATVGNRLLYITITDGTTRVLHAKTITLTANQTGELAVYCGAGYSGVNPQLPGNNADQIWGFPNEIYLQAGWVIRVYDSAAIAAAADDLTVAIQYLEFDV